MDSLVYRARSERRKEPRYAANIDSILTWDGISQQASIRNISIYGILIRGAYLPTMGEQVTIIADHLECVGTVIWRSEDQCGLLLSSPVDPVAILSNHPEWAVQALPAFSRPVTTHVSAAYT